MSFCHLSNIARVRQFISQVDTKKLMHAIISTRLDYSNTLWLVSLSLLELRTKMRGEAFNAANKEKGKGRFTIIFIIILLG